MAIEYSYTSKLPDLTEQELNNKISIPTRETHELLWSAEPSKITSDYDLYCSLYVERKKRELILAQQTSYLFVDGECEEHNIEQTITMIEQSPLFLKWIVYPESFN